MFLLCGVRVEGVVLGCDVLSQHQTEKQCSRLLRFPWPRTCIVPKMRMNSLKSPGDKLAAVAYRWSQANSYHRSPCF